MIAEQSALFESGKATMEAFRTDMTDLANKCIQKKQEEYSQQAGKEIDIYEFTGWGGWDDKTNGFNILCNSFSFTEGNTTFSVSCENKVITKITGTRYTEKGEESFCFDIKNGINSYHKPGLDIDFTGVISRVTSYERNNAGETTSKTAFSNSDTMVDIYSSIVSNSDGYLMPEKTIAIANEKDPAKKEDNNSGENSSENFRTVIQEGKRIYATANADNQKSTVEIDEVAAKAYYNDIEGNYHVAEVNEKDNFGFWEKMSDIIQNGMKFSINFNNNTSFYIKHGIPSFQETPTNNLYDEHYERNTNIFQKLFEFTIGIEIKF